ncbi:MULTISPECIES: hypothetical protein [unclassified Streptomyces]|uniref:hypothetical protein n=1 Tax=unclassified Streptomyces TaxID=2593676 RepID=UPI001F0CF74D|nr:MULTISPECIES: hypothetical protein [unclassified Streptomyces]
MTRGHPERLRAHPFLRAAYPEMYEVAGRGPLTFTGPAFVRFHGGCDDENEALPEGMVVPETAFPQILGAYDAVANWITEHDFAWPIDEPADG